MRTNCINCCIVYCCLAVCWPAGPAALTAYTALSLSLAFSHLGALCYSVTLSLLSFSVIFSGNKDTLPPWYFNPRTEGGRAGGVRAVHFWTNVRKKSKRILGSKPKTNPIIYQISTNYFLFFSSICKSWSRFLF